ncbi:MAG: hypothetical protein LBL57_10740 [Tannerella sp.]|jgi:hypothetical protein|nr:hypothetical protein [Tannerella sp.]
MRADYFAMPEITVPLQWPGKKNYGILMLAGKGNFVFLARARSWPLRGFEKNLHTCASLRVVFFPKTLHGLNTSLHSLQSIGIPA